MAGVRGRGGCDTGRAVTTLGAGLALAVGGWLLVTAGSLAIVVWVVLSLPVDHFVAPRREGAAAPGRTPSRARRVARNLGGALLALVGLLLSLPGIPGQGVLMIVAGVALLDFPGRRALERRLLRRPGVLAGLNGIRARFGRPPLLPP